MRLLLLHSAYGLRPAVHAAAGRLRAAGHTVHVPDLYGGGTADHLERTLALRDRIGRQVLLARALEAAEACAPEALVGFSLGAALAQRVALRRGGEASLVLFHGVAEPAAAPTPGVRVQAHVAGDDPFAPDEELAAWHASFVRAGAAVELHRYAGAGHLFTDPGLADFHEGAASHAWERTQRWLAAPR